MQNVIKDLADVTAAINQIKRHEDFRKFPYRCTEGKLTVGYGFNIEDNGIPEEIAEDWLIALMIEAIGNLRSIFGAGDTWGPVRLTALIDMMYNLGPTKFKTFKKMIAAIKAGDWVLAADEAHDSLWYKQVGARGRTIVRQIRYGGEGA